MRSLHQSAWHPWRAFWNVALTCLLGLCVFAVLNIVSAGLLVTVLTVAAFFVAYALIHYFFWGREMSMRLTRFQGRAPVQSRPEPSDAFVFEIDENERSELQRLLEQSPPHKNPVNGKADQIREKRAATLRRSLLEKIRMFGA